MMAAVGLIKLVLIIVGLIAVVQILAQFYLSSIYAAKNPLYSEVQTGSYIDEGKKSDVYYVEFRRGVQGRLKQLENIRGGDQTKEVEEHSTKPPVDTQQPTNISMPCVLKHKDALSALRRAKTLQCKQEIVDIACQAEANKLYIANIPRYCPIPREKGRPSHNVKAAEERGLPIRIVYILSIHGRAFRQIKRLLKAIYHTQHYFYFHVDSRSNYLHRQILGLASQFPNVAVADWRIATIWGGASLLTMLLRCMQDMLQKTEWKWDFFINISESDFPVQDNSKLVSFLRSHRDENFLKPHGGTIERFIKKQGIDRTFHECDEHMWRIGDRKLPTTIDFDGGSDWIALNKKFCNYVINGQDPMLTGVKQLYKYALLPAESFFHTLLRNSIYCETFARTNLRLTNWKRKLGCRCQYKHIVDWCGCSPNDFKPEDFVRLKTQDKNFFARKFEAMIDQEIVLMMEEWLFGSYEKETTALRSYWENVYHEKDDDISKFDVHLSVCESFARLAIDRLTIQSNNQHDQQCRFATIWRTKESHYYVKENSLHGILVAHDVKLMYGEKKREMRTMEVLATPVNTSRLFNKAMGSPGNRLQGLNVGTSWDQKERVFRNFASMIGPMDDPTLVHRWVHGEVFHVRIVWTDPLNVIAGIYQMKVENNWVISFHKPTFKKPLRPGTWSVKLVYDTAITLGETTFLVVPLAYRLGHPMSYEQAPQFNNGPPAGLYSNDFVVEFDREANNTENLVKDFSSRSQNILSGLDDWIDLLVQRHWRIDGVCVLGTPVEECGGIPSCSTTNWSSRSPDPKSEIGTVNRNGRIR